MSENQKITMEEKAQVIKLFDQFKDNPSGIPGEIKTILTSINDKAWIIKNNVENPIHDRQSAFEVIEKIHKLLGRKFDPAWAPKEKGKGPGRRVVTLAERQSNCDAFKTYLEKNVKCSPDFMAMALSNVWGQP